MQAVPSFILASGSPRRKELLADAGFNFKVVTVDVDESLPPGMAPVQVVEHLARKKLMAGKTWLEKSMVLTADTLVYLDQQIMGKPYNLQEAIAMLQQLSGKMHFVTTSVCLGYQKNTHQFKVTTRVYFAPLNQAEIAYYVEQYRPFDKAGSYGIQEWIGQIGITKIEGSYTNVVGLPMPETYRAIIDCSKQWLS